MDEVGLRQQDNNGDWHDITLKRCPFCGEFPDVTFIGNNYTKSRKVIIKCPSCRVQRTDSGIVNGFAWLLDKACEHWNARATKRRGAY